VRARRLLTLAACALLLAAAGCSEKKSGLGEKQAQSTPSTTPTATTGEPPSGAGGASAKEAASRSEPTITVPKGPPPKKLVVKDIIKGSGPIARSGSQLAVNYRGVAYSTGKTFDSSFGRGQPFQFPLGAGQVIPGWDQGLEGMRVGGRRELIVPAGLAYGSQGGPGIKPGETLIFQVDLLGAR
jgi:FKBP-type peptidyl-prolyl cis-trans isomerase